MRKARADASRALAISQFLQSWGPLQEKLNGLLACEDAEILRIEQNAVSPDKLHELNCHILQRKAIRMVFAMVDELKEDLHGDEPSSEPE